jgi:hypothetical protein
VVVDEKRFGVVSYLRGLPENFDVFPSLGLHFVRFLNQMFEYRALHYTVDRLNRQLSTCMVCLCKHHNSVCNLFILAFQQLKSIGSGICYPLGNFLQHNV